MHILLMPDEQVCRNWLVREKGDLQHCDFEAGGQSPDW